jgi:hypothetical protein
MIQQANISVDFVDAQVLKAPCLFVFLALQPIEGVFSQPGSGF